MEFGHAVTAWTIRLALVAYVGTVALGFPATGANAVQAVRYRIARWIWLAGGLLVAAHVGAALHYYHGWSHPRALADTAQQTKDMLGWAFGEGIYFSYLFALVWLGDALWWCLWPSGFAARPRLVHAAIQAYLAFIAFNGAIVFESGVTRWIGLSVVPVLALVVWGRYRGGSGSSRPNAVTNDGRRQPD
jgi:hypothetical protein